MRSSSAGSTICPLVETVVLIEVRYRLTSLGVKLSELASYHEEDMAKEPSASNLRRFLELSSFDQRLLFEAWWRLLAAALRLRFAPRRTVTRAVRETAAPDGPEERYDKGGTVPAVALAVARAAAHHLQPMTCLPRALALQRMLARRGVDSVLRIGVRKEAEAIAAHAWVEVDGRAVGEPEAIETRFRALLPAAGRTDRHQAP